MENDTKLIPCPCNASAAPWQELRCHWVGSIPKESGHARVYWDNEFLYVEAELFDSDIFNTATFPDQRMWELGDAFEVFIHPDRARKNYFEFQVTPENLLLNLALTSAEKKDEGWKNRADFKSGATARVEKGTSLWKPKINIPWADLGIVPGEGKELGFAACRYNYTRGGGGTLGTPECSSTAPFSAFSFHRPEEFSALLLAN